MGAKIQLPNSYYYTALQSLKEISSLITVL